MEQFGAVLCTRQGKVMLPRTGLPLLGSRGPCSSHVPTGCSQRCPQGADTNVVISCVLGWLCWIVPEVGRDGHLQHSHSIIVAM